MKGTNFRPSNSSRHGFKGIQRGQHYYLLIVARLCVDPPADIQSIFSRPQSAWMTFSSIHLFSLFLIQRETDMMNENTLRKIQNILIVCPKDGATCWTSLDADQRNSVAQVVRLFLKVKGFVVPTTPHTTSHSLNIYPHQRVY